MRRGQQDKPISISDAQPSFEDTQRRRKRVYAILMVIHLTGFALAGVLAQIWWLALAIVAVTGPLPWVAVVIANDRPPRKRREADRLTRDHQPPHAAPRTLHGASTPDRRWPDV